MSVPKIKQAPFCDRFNFPWWLNNKGLIRQAAEVGTHRGDFAAGFLRAWIGRKLHCVDHYQQGYDSRDPASKGDREKDCRAALAALSEFGDRVVMHVRPSVVVAKKFASNELGFVYIDACHQYAEVLNDLRAWWPKIHAGGVLAGHDFLERGVEWPEVQRALWRFCEIEGVDTIHLVTEPSGAPWSYYVEKPT